MRCQLACVARRGDGMPVSADACALRRALEAHGCVHPLRTGVKAPCARVVSVPQDSVTLGKGAPKLPREAQVALEVRTSSQGRRSCN